MKRWRLESPFDVFRDTPEGLSLRRRVGWFWLLAVTAFIFTIEYVVMITLDSYTSIPREGVIFIDGFLLVCVIFPLTYILIIRPMTQRIEERRRSIEVLAKSQEIFDHFFSVSDIMLAYMDSEFNFIRVNKAYADADERKVDEFPGKNHFTLYPNEENQQIFQSVVDSGKPFSILEKPFFYAANPERGVTYWDWHLFPIKNTEGRVTELLMILNNVTDRHNNQLALAEKDRQFRAVFDQTYHFNTLMDKDGVIQMMNKSGLDFMQLSPEQVYGKHIWEMPNLDRKAVEQPLRDAFREAMSGAAIHREYKVRYPDGSEATLDTTTKAIVDSEGSSRLLLVEAQDITPRVRAEEALKKNETKLEELYNAEKQARESADLLRNAVLAFANSPDIDTIFENLLDYLHKASFYELAHIFLFDENNMLTVSHSRGEERLDEKDRLTGKTLDPEDAPILAPLFRDHCIIVINDSDRYPGSNITFPSFSIGSWIGLPLVVSNQLIGLCILGHSEKNFFHSELPQWAYTLVSQSAVAIQNSWLFEQISESRERLQALSRRLVEVQEKERRYVAQELHDETGQALAAIKVGLMLLEHESADAEKVVKRSKELNSVVDEVLENLHRLAMDLRPAALDHLGLVAAMRQHAELVSAQTGMAVHFETGGEIGRLPGDMEIAIYRIVQEALTNVVKHARATRVDIMFERRKDSILIIVEDNGIGFSPKELTDGHLGTVGMRERAEMLGGSLRIESAPGEGYAVFLEVPCPSEL